ncbi:hypothetical protein QUB68_23955 [Microcoleus sp. A006_D1]|uniref:hypothetical protein n=1 Tax=Microcoleus sp. A006_D1 TaxID=3055267 RepID=UPI002FD4ECB8
MTENRKPEKAKDFSEKFLQISGKVVRVIGKIIKWWFWLSMFGVGLIFWLLDLWLGDGSNPVPFPGSKPRPKFDPNEFKNELENATVEQIINQFNKEFEKIENRNKLEPEEKRVIRKIKGLDRSKLRSQIVRDNLDQDELEILFLLLLKILSGELG